MISYKLLIIDRTYFDITNVHQKSRHNDTDVKPQVRCDVQHTRDGQSLATPSVRTTSLEYSRLRKLGATSCSVDPCRSIGTHTEAKVDHPRSLPQLINPVRPTHPHKFKSYPSLIRRRKDFEHSTLSYFTKS